MTLLLTVRDTKHNTNKSSRVTHDYPKLILALENEHKFQFSGKREPKKNSNNELTRHHVCEILVGDCERFRAESVVAFVINFEVDYRSVSVGSYFICQFVPPLSVSIQHCSVFNRREHSMKISDHGTSSFTY